MSGLMSTQSADGGKGSLWLAVNSGVAIECEHGYDVCPECDAEDPYVPCPGCGLRNYKTDDAFWVCPDYPKCAEPLIEAALGRHKNYSDEQKGR